MRWGRAGGTAGRAPQRLHRSGARHLPGRPGRAGGGCRMRVRRGRELDAVRVPRRQHPGPGPVRGRPRGRRAGLSGAGHHVFGHPWAGWRRVGRRGAGGSYPAQTATPAARPATAARRRARGRRPAGAGWSCCGLFLRAMGGSSPRSPNVMIRLRFVDHREMRRQQRSRYIHRCRGRTGGSPCPLSGANL